MSIFSFVSSVLQPITNLVQTFKLPPEKEVQLRIELEKIESNVSLKVLDYEKQLMDAQASVLKAEAISSSWVTRSWRPITALVFVYIIFNNYILGPYFGIPTTPIPEKMWVLLQIMIGGYVASRGIEKSIPSVIKVINGKNNK